jgi:hypothetical protein
LGHEQVKITEKFILTSDVDAETVQKELGFFFQRNKDELNFPPDEKEEEEKDRGASNG